MERLVFHEIFPVLGTLIFPGFSPVCRYFNFFKITLYMVYAVVCGDFEEIFQSSPVCIPWCGVETFELFEKFPCVGPYYKHCTLPSACL